MKVIFILSVILLSFGCLCNKDITTPKSTGLTIDNKTYMAGTTEFDSGCFYFSNYTYLTNLQSKISIYFFKKPTSSRSYKLISSIPSDTFSSCIKISIDTSLNSGFLNYSSQGVIGDSLKIIEGSIDGSGNLIRIYLNDITMKKDNDFATTKASGYFIGQ